MKRFAFVLVVLVVTVASAFASLNFSYNVQLEGLNATMESEEGRSYEIWGMGAALVVKLLGRDSGIGIRGRIGASYAPDATLNGSHVTDGFFSSEYVVHDYTADVGLLVEIPGDISPYAGLLLTWDSVDFRTGGNRDWHRTSYRTLGIGWTLGLAGNLTPSVRIDVGWTENYALSTYRVRSRRENGSTTEGSKYYLEDKKGTFDRLSLAITFSY